MGKVGNLPDFKIEKSHWKRGVQVGGADEVGMGAFAGPVVAAVVVFTQNTISTLQGTTLEGVAVRDSKMLSFRQRQRADIWIRQRALCFAVGVGSVYEINKKGIKKASQSALRRAFFLANKKLTYEGQLPINHLLLDAFFLPRTKGLPVSPITQTAIIKGDKKSFSIAAASIVAKVHRDGLMTTLGSRAKYKKYLWNKNKGYGTLEHIKAIGRLGATHLHRKAFVKTFLGFNGFSSSRSQ